MLNVLEAQDIAELGERLRVARANAGLTQGDAAERLRLARTTLLAVEKGQRRVRPDELRDMASLYDISINALLRPTSVHVDLAPRFRSLSGAGDGPAAEAARLLNDLVAAEVEIERLVGQPLRANYPPERPILSGDIREQAEEVASELRHRFGLGLAPIKDVVRLLELDLGIRVFIRPLRSGSISGLYAFDDELGACILLNRHHSPRRRALTAAHELGHLVATRREPDVVDLAHDPTSREERYAKSFALAFMMPAAAMRRWFHDTVRATGRFSPRHLVFLAQEYSVSEEAMCRRLEELQLLPGGTWESLSERKFSAEEIRRSLGDQPSGLEVIVSPRLWLLAGEAYRCELLSEGQLARMLRIDRVEVRAMLDALDAEGAHDLRSVSAI